MIKKLPKKIVPLFIILNSIFVTFLISRFLTYLIITGVLPANLFASIKGFRLHHFVYGNIIIIVTSFLSIGLEIKGHKNLFALTYGIGLGLILDEFLLWLGNIDQLSANVLFIPHSTTVIAGVTLIIASVIMYRLYARTSRS